MNNSYFDTIYIGYLYYPGMENILLCVSEDRYKVEYYTQEIRGLSRKMVDIRKVTLNLETAESLYGDFMLESYIEPYNYLTRRDIQGLNREIETSLDRWTDMICELKEYQTFIEDIPRFYDSSDVLRLTIKTLENQLSSVKCIKRLSKEIIAKSPITSRNIHTYLNALKVVEEDRQLTELFYRAVDDD